jgi:hypothetical protein
MRRGGLLVSHCNAGGLWFAEIYVYNTLLVEVADYWER